MTRYLLPKVKPWVKAAADEFGTRHKITTIGGWRASAVDMNGHPAGRALDFMTTSKKQGDALAADLLAQADRIGLEYVIWRQQIKHPGGSWRMMEDRGSPTQNHMDHVHANFNATAPKGSPGKNPLPSGSGYTSTKVQAPRPVATNAAFGLPDVFPGDVTDAITRLALYGGVLVGGVLLIGVGVARLAKPTVDSVKDDAMTALSILPQGKAAAAATATKGATT